MFEWLFGKKKPQSPTMLDQLNKASEPSERSELVRELEARAAAESQRQRDAEMEHRRQAREAKEAQHRKEEDRLKEVYNNCRAYMSQPNMLDYLENTLKSKAANAPNRILSMTTIIRDALIKAKLFNGEDDGPEHRKAMSGAANAITPYFRQKGITVELIENSEYSYREQRDFSSNHGGTYTASTTGQRKGIAFKW